MKNRIYFSLFLFSLLAFINVIPVWATVASVVIAVHAWLALHGRILTLKNRMIGLFALLAGAIVCWQFGTLLGPEPATTLLVILAALKLEELRSVRDTIVYLFIILLLVMYYLLESQTILSTLYMFCMVFATAVAFIIAHTPEDKTRRVLRASPGLVFKDIALSLPFFIVLFIFFPRFSTPWASLFAKDQSVIGFSEDLTPGKMAQLVGSEEPAFRVTFKDKVPRQDEMYWRGIVLDETDGWNWKASKEYQDSRLSQASVKENSDYRTIEYEITLEPRFNKMLFTLAQTFDVEWKETNNYNTIHKKEAATFTTNFNSISRSVYKGRAYVDKMWQEEIPPLRTADFSKPVVVTGKVSELVGQFLKNSKDAASYADLVMNFFSTGNFIYTTDTPEMPGLENFLFEVKSGFCEHYASAFAALMRAGGYPARVVIGFQGGEYNDVGGFYLIRDQHAHAWAEIRHNDSWWVYDPTSAVNAARIQMGSLSEALPQFRPSQTKIFFRKLEGYYYALEAQYSNLLSAYNLDVQNEFFGIRERGKMLRYMAYLAIGLLVLALAIYLFNIYRSRTKQDPLMDMQAELFELVRSKGYPVNMNEGALTIQKRLQSYSPAQSEQIDKAFTEWIQYRYRDYAQDPDRTARVAKLKKAISRVVSSLPPANP